MEEWLGFLERAEAQVENECIDSEDVWNVIQKINNAYRETPCAYPRNPSNSGTSVQTPILPNVGYVERVLGVLVDNSNPQRPIVAVYVDGTTITGTGTEEDPFVAVGGGVNYQGTWNATTNNPALASGVGTKGYYYVVSVAGSTNLDGITSWQLGDWVIFNGTAWEKVDNTDAVISVNGQTGIVSLTTADITELTNLYFTEARVLATLLTGFSAAAGTVTTSDSILTAFNKVVGNISAKENSANKATDFTTVNNTLFPTTQAVVNYFNSRPAQYSTNATAPTTAYDSSAGYAVGYRITVPSGLVYVCSDATIGAAVWKLDQSHIYSWVKELTPTDILAGGYFDIDEMPAIAGGYAWVVLDCQAQISNSTTPYDGGSKVSIITDTAGTAQFSDVDTSLLVSGDDIGGMVSAITLTQTFLGGIYITNKKVQVYLNNSSTVGNGTLTVFGTSRLIKTV